MRKWRLVGAGLVCVMLGATVGGASAQGDNPEHAPWHSGNYWGAGAQITLPRGVFRDDYANGFGLQGLFNYPLIALIDLSGSVGWNHFSGANDGDGIDIWELGFGGRFALGVFFMSGEMGYFSRVDEWNFVPGLGLRFDHWEFSLRTKAVHDTSWSSLRLGYYF